MLALLPLQVSPFQARFAGPYTIARQVSDQNYMISTPNHRKSSQLYHVNLLKPYYAHGPPVTSDSVAREVHVGPALMVDSVLPDVGAPEAGLDTKGDCLKCQMTLLCIDDPTMCGRLKNSESLCQLDKLLGHLPASQRTELVELIRKFPMLFGDTPTQTNLTLHDIDVGDSPPITQHCSADKRMVLEGQSDHSAIILQLGIT